MKRIPLIVLSIVSLTMPLFVTAKSSETDYPLGVFNFDFARLGADEASRISELNAIGYGGMTLRVNSKKQLEELKRYQAAIGDSPFRIYAGFYTADLNADIAAQNAHLDHVIQALKKSEAKLWIILRAKGPKKVEEEQIVDFLASLAKRTKAGGVELVIYPHWSGSKPLNLSLFETAEDALPYLEEVQNGNVYLSLHLSHELLADNGDRLDEIAAKIGDRLRLPSINGAYTDSVNFDRGIVPLTEGDYDASKLLKAVKSAGYEGPVVLHTWNLHEAAADHHHTSYKRYQEMLDAQ